MERAMKDKDSKTTDREMLQRHHTKRRNRVNDGPELRQRVEQPAEQKIRLMPFHRYKIMEDMLLHWMRTAEGDTARMFASEILSAWGVEVDPSRHTSARL
jgi:hypothetical protein